VARGNHSTATVGERWRRLPGSRHRSLTVAVLFVALCGGCEGAPAAGSLKEWTPGDHHSSDDEKASGQQAAQGARQPSGSDVPQLVELTWRQQCTNCHGPLGKGDGQMGAMLHAPDLTSADLQAKVTDQEMATIIKGGKDKMPAFNLPDPVLQAMVARIRLMRGR
jgi:mono/diheme cytochrome c family protein